MLSLSHVRPAWQEVDLDAIAHNVREIRRHIGPNVLFTAVIKANSCGHGAIKVAPVVLANGADRLAVANLEEALELRRAGINSRILILGATEPSRADEIIANDLDQAVFTMDLAKALSRTAQAVDQTARVHIKVDSGMGRIGFLPTEESLTEIEAILSLPNIGFEGLFTHFSTADETDKTYSHLQHERFSIIRDGLKARGLVPTICHMGNSATIIDLKEYHYDMVRAGIILYGQPPSQEVSKDVLSLKPSMAIKARIVNVKTLGDHEAVSYGRKYWTEGERRIATLPIGYADGYTRLFSNKAEVLVHGQRAPIIGNICMDQCMIDVTHIPDVAIGDEVVLMGAQHDDAITYDELATLIGTIPYEILCMIGRRIPRVYKQGGVMVETLNYLLD